MLYAKVAALEMKAVSRSGESAASDVRASDSADTKKGKSGINRGLSGNREEGGGGGGREREGEIDDIGATGRVGRVRRRRVEERVRFVSRRRW